MPTEDGYAKANTAREMGLALRYPLQPWSDPALLSFPAAAEELLAWLADARAFDSKFHSSAFASVARDYDRAADRRLGTKVKAVLSVELAEVQDALKPLRTAWSGDREPARSALRTLIGRLGGHEVLQASWRDLWAKVSQTRTSEEVIAPVRDLFLALAHRAGHDLGLGSSFISLVRGVLADDDWSVTQMRSNLGDPLPAHTGQQLKELMAAAGLTIGERRELCDRFLGLPVASRWHAVWLLYEKASMPFMYAELGDISFFPTAYASSDAQAVTEKYGSYARDWTTTDCEVLAGMPHRQGLIGVRVFLPQGVYADPVAVARARADALVAVGRFRAGLGSDDWRLVEGHTHINDERSAEQVFQLGADTEMKPLDHGRQAAVFTELKAFWEQMGSASPVDDDRLAEAVELLRWWQAAQEQSPLARVISEVRVIETAASRIGSGEWCDHLTAFLEPAWIVLAIHTDLRRTILNALGGSYGGGEEGLDRQARERRRAVAATRDTRDYPWITLVPGTTRTAMAELLEIYPEHHRTRRSLRTLASRMDSHAAYGAWLTQLRAQWTDLICRLERVRNAITHGGPATADAVRSVNSFSSQLSAWDVQLALEAALQNTSAHTVHLSFQQDHNDLLDKIRNASTPGEVIHHSAVPPR